MRRVARLRPGLAGVAGAAVAFAAAVVLGEYPLTGLVPYAAALIVPALVVAVATTVDRARPAVWWPAGAVLGAGGVGLGAWFSLGRGLDPWPLAATVAVMLALVWPLALTVVRRRRGSGPPVVT